jgi:hypothetical protein
MLMLKRKFDGGILVRDDLHPLSVPWACRDRFNRSLVWQYSMKYFRTLPRAWDALLQYIWTEAVRQALTTTSGLQCRTNRPTPPNFQCMGHPTCSVDGGSPLDSVLETRLGGPGRSTLFTARPPLPANAQPLAYSRMH